MKENIWILLDFYERILQLQWFSTLIYFMSFASQMVKLISLCDIFIFTILNRMSEILFRNLNEDYVKYRTYRHHNQEISLIEPKLEYVLRRPWRKGDIPEAKIPGIFSGPKKNYLTQSIIITESIKIKESIILEPIMK